MEDNSNTKETLDKNVESSIKKRERKSIDEGNLVTEYLFLIISILFIPFFVILFIIHGVNYFRIKESSEGVISHYRYITKLIYQSVIVFFSAMGYMLLLKVPTDQPNIIISTLFLIFVITLLVQSLKKLKMLARHEI